MSKYVPFTFDQGRAWQLGALTIEPRISAPAHHMLWGPELGLVRKHLTTCTTKSDGPLTKVTTFGPPHFGPFYSHASHTSISVSTQSTRHSATALHSISSIQNTSPKWRNQTPPPPSRAPTASALSKMKTPYFKPLTHIHGQKTQRFSYANLCKSHDPLPHSLYTPPLAHPVKLITTSPASPLSSDPQALPAHQQTWPSTLVYSTTLNG